MCNISGSKLVYISEREKSVISIRKEGYDEKDYFNNNDTLWKKQFTILQEER